MSAANLPVYDQNGVVIGYLQTFRNTIDGTAVDAEAVTLVDSSGKSFETFPTRSIHSDLFGNGVASPRQNQIEVDFSLLDPDANTDVTVTKTNGGDASNSPGHAVFTSGTNTSGRVQCVSAISLDYRPNHEVYAGFTASFTAGIANSYQRIGLFNATDGFFLGYENGVFGVTHRFNGTDTFVSTFNTDPLDGSADSLLTRDGVPEALDKTKSNLFRIRFGWFGSAPAVFEVFGPDGQWVMFHQFRFPNSQVDASLATTILPITLDIRKTVAGASALEMTSGCWAAGTTSALQALTATITDKTLAQTVRAVLTGRTTAGGSSYVNVKVNPSGTLATANTSVGAPGAAIPAEATLVAGTDGGTLRALAADSAGRASVRDIYTGGETLADQSGAGAVLTFTFSAAVQLAMVFAKSAAGTLEARADPFGGTPSAVAGIPCDDGVPNALTVNTSSVKVFAPVGMTVSVWGFRY